jgi:hypothetical protein
MRKSWKWWEKSCGSRRGHPELTKCPSLVDVLDMKERRTKLEENRKQRRATLRERLAKGQQLVRQRVPPTVSLADELIAERREESRRESDPRS